MNKYKNIEKIKPETLLSLVREVLEQSVEFKYISGIQPFFMAFNKQKFYVYVKNISSAYFSDRDKTTRAQLPIKPEFDAIKSSPYPFIFLGYDGLTDVFVCWNYNLAKERLNIGKSVSFYSRTYFQSEVKDGEFIRRQLKNGDLPVLFKRNNLIKFFEKIDTFFPIKKESNLNNTIEFVKYSYEEKFRSYLKFKKKLSDKSIKNYVNALKGRISEGLKKHFIPSLESIFFIDNKFALEKLNFNLFKTEEFKQLNITGKNMYSCAFDNYIDFINVHIKSESHEISKKEFENEEEHSKNGKLLKITNSDLLSQLKPYVNSNRLLSAAQIVGNHFQSQYPKMELSDWIKLVREIK